MMKITKIQDADFSAAYVLYMLVEVEDKDVYNCVDHTDAADEALKSFSC